MTGQTSRPEIFWFFPCAGDGRHLGAPIRPNGFAYLASVAQAADTLGFDGVAFYRPAEREHDCHRQRIEEAYSAAQLLFPAMGRASSIFQAVQGVGDSPSAQADYTPIARFSSI
jgi:hypothetical protein